MSTSAEGEGEGQNRGAGETETGTVVRREALLLSLPCLALPSPYFCPAFSSGKRRQEEEGPTAGTGYQGTDFSYNVAAPIPFPSVTPHSQPCSLPLP